MIRILLADDHPIVREGLRALLETQPDFEVVAECANGDEALAIAAHLQADILLLDLEMPIMDGVETIRRLRQLSHYPRIIVFTAFDDDDRIINAIQAGADGYLLKDAPRDEIFKAIRITIEGGSILQPVVTSKLQQKDLTLLQIAPTAPPILPDEELSERELEVLRLLAQGMPNKEIAAHLMIRERTAKFHVSSIMNKLGASNRTEAVALAVQRGLITLHA